MTRMNKNLVCSGLRDLSSVKGALVAVTTCRLVVFQHAQKHHYRVRLLVEEFQLLGCEGCDVIGDPVYITDDEGIYRRLYQYLGSALLYTVALY